MQGVGPKQIQPRMRPDSFEDQRLIMAGRAVDDGFDENLAGDLDLGGVEKVRAFQHGDGRLQVAFLGMANLGTDGFFQDRLRRERMECEGDRERGRKQAATNCENAIPAACRRGGKAGLRRDIGIGVDFEDVGAKLVVEAEIDAAVIVAADGSAGADGQLADLLGDFFGQGAGMTRGVFWYSKLSCRHLAS